MKILLINQPQIFAEGLFGTLGGLPIGLLSIAAVLEKNNFAVKIIDCIIRKLENGLKGGWIGKKFTA